MRVFVEAMTTIAILQRQNQSRVQLENSVIFQNALKDVKRGLGRLGLDSLPKDKRQNVMSLLGGLPLAAQSADDPAGASASNEFFIDEVLRIADQLQKSDSLKGLLFGIAKEFECTDYLKRLTQAEKNGPVSNPEQHDLSILNF